MLSHPILSPQLVKVRASKTSTVQTQHPATSSKWKIKLFPLRLYIFLFCKPARGQTLLIGSPIHNFKIEADVYIKVIVVTL